MIRIFACSVVLAVLACSCSSLPYERIEELDPRRGTHVFRYKYETGEEVGLVLRQNTPLQASVAIVLQNNSYLDMEITGKAELFIDGKAVEMEPIEKPIPEQIGHGDTVVIRLNYVIDETESVAGAETAKLVYARLGRFVTPTVIVELSEDNMVPFRFAVLD